MSALGRAIEKATHILDLAYGGHPGSVDIITAQIATLRRLRDLERATKENRRHSVITPDRTIIHATEEEVWTFETRPRHYLHLAEREKNPDAWRYYCEDCSGLPDNTSTWADGS